MFQAYYSHRLLVALTQPIQIKSKDIACPAEQRVPVTSLPLVRPELLVLTLAPSHHGFHITILLLDPRFPARTSRVNDRLWSSVSTLSTCCAVVKIALETTQSPGDIPARPAHRWQGLLSLTTSWQPVTLLANGPHCHLASRHPQVAQRHLWRVGRQPMLITPRISVQYLQPS